MLTTTRVSRVDLDRVALSTPLLARTILDVTAAHLPQIPTDWRVVYGREIVTATQRFAAYTTACGLSLGLHSAVDLHPELTGRLIALVNLGGHRIAVHAGEQRFEARWSCGKLTHRLTAEPLTLGRFMELILNLNWRAQASGQGHRGRPHD